MKIKKILAAAAAAAVAVSTMALNAFAADIWTGSNDMGTDWNGDNALKIEASLFADTKGGDTVEISYTTDADNAVLQLKENTTDWPKLTSTTGAEPQWGNIAVEKGSGTYSFVISAEDAARVQANGMVVFGNSVTVTKVAVTAAAAEEAAPAEEEAAPAEEAAAPEEDEAEAEDVDVDAEEEEEESASEPVAIAETDEAAPVEEAAPAAAETGSAAPKTGNVPAASMLAVMAAAGVAAVASKKRK